MICLMLPVMGKSQIKSHCQISNHSVNRFKSFNQISNPIFPQISNLLIIVVNITVCSLIFDNSKNVIFIQLVSDHSQLLAVWSVIHILNRLQLRLGLDLLRLRLGVSVISGKLNVFVISRHQVAAYAF